MFIFVVFLSVFDRGLRARNKLLLADHGILGDRSDQRRFGAQTPQSVSRLSFHQIPGLLARTK
jgi:hypothetical protein